MQNDDAPEAAAATPTVASSSSPPPAFEATPPDEQARRRSAAARGGGARGTGSNNGGVARCCDSPTSAARRRPRRRRRRHTTDRRAASFSPSFSAGARFGSPPDDARARAADLILCHAVKTAARAADAPKHARATRARQRTHTSARLAPLLRAGASPSQFRTCACVRATHADRPTGSTRWCLSSRRWRRALARPAARTVCVCEHVSQNCEFV